MSSDEGLRIGGRGALDEFKGSDKQGESDCILETKLGFTIQILGSPLLAPPRPLYRWLGPRVLVRHYTNSFYVGIQYNFPIRILLLLAPFLGHNLRETYPNMSQGYQCHGPWQAYPCHLVYVQTMEKFISLFIRTHQRKTLQFLMSFRISGIWVPKDMDVA
jgi:hypothetical protein